MIGATTRHHDVATSADVASHAPGARGGRRDGRRPAGAQPRHARRLARARGTARRPACGDARARRRDRRAGAVRRAHDRGRRLLHRLLLDGARRGRARHRRSASPARSRRAPTSSSTAGRSTGRSSASRSRRGGDGWRIGLTGVAPTAVRARGVEEALARGASVARGVAPGRRGSRPAGRPRRLGRVQAAPRDRAGRAGRWSERPEELLRRYSEGMRYASLTTRIRGAGADAWAVHDLALARVQRGDDVIVLSIGESDIDTPPAIVDAGVRALRDGRTRYTPQAGTDGLREAVARHVGALSDDRDRARARRLLPRRADGAVRRLPVPPRRGRRGDRPRADLRHLRGGARHAPARASSTCPCRPSGGFHLDPADVERARHARARARCCSPRRTTRPAP